MIVNKKRFFQKLSNSVAKRMIDFINIKSDFYIAAKPDYARDLNKINEFEKLYKIWTEKSKKANSIDLTRFYMLHMQIDYILKNNISGAIAELGVFRGTTARFFRELLPDRELYLFDTFEGFDKRDTRDMGTSGEFAESLENVRAFVGEDKTYFIKGYFPESANDFNDKIRFALVQLDADLYNPQKSGLDFFYPRMTKGGVIVVHDCNNVFSGSRDALEQFCTENKLDAVYMPDKSGSAILIKR